MNDMTENEASTAADPLAEVETLRQQAEEASAAYDWDKALELYTQALATPELPPEMEIPLREGRANCHNYKFNLKAEESDLEAMLRLAKESGDLPNRIKAAKELAGHRLLERTQRGIELAEEALVLAREAGERRLEVEALVSLAAALREAGEHEVARETNQEALALASELDYKLGLAMALHQKGYNARYVQGDAAAAERELKRALALFREIGERRREAYALLVLGMVNTDIGRQRRYYERSLEAYEAIGHIGVQSILYNNLSFVFWRLGLYKRAEEYARRSLAMQPEKDTRENIMPLLTLAEAHIGLGANNRARAVIEETEALLSASEDSTYRGIYPSFLLGLVELGEGHPEKARRHLAEAVDGFTAANESGWQITSLAWLGAADLALGDVAAAREQTAQALAIPGLPRDYPPQEAWWWRYQALAAGGEEATPPEAWLALDRARELMFAQVATIGDEGLRRNFLSKVTINRDVVLAWSRLAARRGQSLAPFLERESSPASLSEQFSRLVEIGGRLTAQRDPEELVDFIMDQFVELSGAERAFLTLSLSDAADFEWAAAEGIPDEEAPEVKTLAAPLLEAAGTSWQPVLRDSLGIAPEDDVPALHLRSAIALPLVSQGVVYGYLYGDLRHIFGRFGQGDLNLLSMLANQAASALENAEWTRSLEGRVEERTAELQAANQSLEERNAELSLINTVGQALARQLDFQAIIDTVGDQIGRLFDSETVYIALIDWEAQQAEFPYWLEEGQRIFPDPTSLEVAGLTAHVARSREPLVINRDLKKRVDELGGHYLDDTSIKKSWLGVPIVAGDRAIGVMALMDSQRKDAYSKGDVRLLSTLANSLGTSLENARLFDETNRLLAETEQRNAELAVINSVQEGLAAELDIQAIYDLVGDTIGDIFQAQSVLITTFDHAAERCHIRYTMEKGQRFALEPIPFNDLHRTLIREHDPVVVNKQVQQWSKEMGLKTQPGTEPVKSMVFVPLTAGGQVRGYVSLQNVDQEDAFGESDVRLLTTLANSMSVALENARLFEETNQRAAELAMINSVQVGLASNLDFQRIIDLVGEKVREIFATDNMSIALYDAGANQLSFPYFLEDGQRHEIKPTPLTSGFSHHVIHAKKPLLVNENLEQQMVELGSTGIGDLDAPAPAGYLGVPILSGDRATGVIALYNHDSASPFDESDVSLLTTLANSMSVALENARLFDETNQRAAELAIINSVQEGLVAQMDIQAIYDLVGRQIGDIFPRVDLSIRIIDRTANLVHFTYSVVGGKRKTFESQPLTEEGFIGHVLRTRQSFLVNEKMEGAMARHGSYVIPGGRMPKSLLMVPLVIGAEVRGTIDLSDYEREYAFDESDVDLLTTLANSMSVALENARLFEETRRRANEMAALNEIGREITATLETSRVLERIATRAKEVLNARDTVLRLLQPDGSLPAVVALGKNAAMNQAYDMQIGEGITGSVVESGMAEVVNDPIHDPRVTHTPGTDREEDEDEATLFAPLTVRDKVIGVMVVWREKSAHGPFSQNDLDFAVGLAGQAAIAIENARLFDEVQQQRQYSEALVQNSPVAIVTTDLESNIVSWNPAARRLFGYRPEEAIGRNLDQLVASERRIEEASTITQQVAREGLLSTVTRRYRKDGTAVDVELLGLPVVVEGEKVGIIAIYHDISELLEARQEAEAANEAKSAFLATMSHEIRTPMNAIIGMTGLLLDTELDQEQREFAEIIRGSGDALLTIINDILDFSKIEAGKMDVEMQPFDLRDCLESALDLVAIKAAEKGLELAYLLEPDVPPAIVGDITRLRQILINLLNNAVKFTNEGEVVVTVRRSANSDGRARAADEDPQTTLHFSVRDTGIGIAEERIVRLFQAFSQVDASTTRKYGGTGLGLAISKRLSELMGGEMWVESEEGEGTTFHFTICVEEAPTFKSRPHLEGEQAPLAGKRLLMVDDNATNRRIMMMQTRAWGMLSRDTDSPEEALAWIARGDPFDVAILDMHMPGMDGLELARAIREHRPADALPLVLFSSLNRREAEAKGVEFAAYLLKPLKPSALFDTLMNVLGEGKEEAARPAKKAPAMDQEMGKDHPLRILLAEDNAVNQKVALRLLERLGYRADVAANGLEAIEALERQTYDVILMDVQMPEMDGLEASRVITARWPRDGRPRIVAMTANATLEDRQRCFEAGMDDYVSKPVRVDELVAALERTPACVVP